MEDSILEVLAEAEQFTQFLAAVDAAGLTEMLSGGGPFTVFAPTDEAFAAFGELPTDPAALGDLVRYHIVEGSLTAYQLLEAEEVTTVLGAPIAVALDEGFIVLNGVRGPRGGLPAS